MGVYNGLTEVWMEKQKCLGLRPKLPKCTPWILHCTKAKEIATNAWTIQPWIEALAQNPFLPILNLRSKQRNYARDTSILIPHSSMWSAPKPHSATFKRGARIRQLQTHDPDSIMDKKKAQHAEKPSSRFAWVSHGLRPCPDTINRPRELLLCSSRTRFTIERRESSRNHLQRSSSSPYWSRH